MDVLFITYIIMTLGMFFVGFAFGILTKGINITHKHEAVPVQVQPKEPVKYNESTASELPQDIKEYFMETKGFVK